MANSQPKEEEKINEEESLGLQGVIGFNGWCVPCDRAELTLPPPHPPTLFPPFLPPNLTLVAPHGSQVLCPLALCCTLETSTSSTPWVLPSL